MVSREASIALRCRRINVWQNPLLPAVVLYLARNARFACIHSQQVEAPVVSLFLYLKN